MILVIGGSGSGKSAYAEKVALECQKEKRHFYLATMHVFGEEGQKKVERHRKLMYCRMAVSWAAMAST